MPRLTCISSDGHATAVMADYRDYLETRYLEEFDAFLVEWELHGSRNFDPPALSKRLGPADIDDWKARFLDNGRLDGNSDPQRRLKEMESEGVVAEVLFPDFGTPFELYSAQLASALGVARRDEEHTQIGNRAFNRWLADFVSTAPDRFVGMGAVSWSDVDTALADIRAVHKLGLSGIVLPHFPLERPLYHPDFEPVWNLLDELGLIVNSHGAMSSTSDLPIFTPGLPHPGCSSRLMFPQLTFFQYNMLTHLIYGAVLERHPDLTFVFTEMGTDWVVPALRDMDYSYEGSYYRDDFKSVIRSKPSDYYFRQCYMGSSIFTKAEIDHRYQIGLDKMMLGMDYPHHEGTLIETTQNYLQATLGAAEVPLDEATKLVGGTAAKVFGFDLTRLDALATEIGPEADDILTPPEVDLFPRGDVHRPGPLVG